ncbi:MAG TPA: SIMPL domain-containing protein [Jatrophihabitans sp.]|nr:SIMPL domain-containing protein [Jatrophihabitans sp.]
MSTDHTLLSVRGHARRMVAPDQAIIHCAVSKVADSPGAASAAVGAVLTEVTGELAALGGQPLTPDTVRAPLTWSAQSLSVQAEYDHDKATGRHGPTGRHHASVALLLTLRDFTLSETITGTITGHSELSVHSVNWAVDADNPGWQQVRADAIQAALRTGQHYAAALGGTVVAVQHVADAGLLGGEAPGPHVALAYAASAGGGLSSPGDTIALDPVPQELSATIEARFTATVGPLPAD